MHPAAFKILKKNSVSLYPMAEVCNPLCLLPNPVFTCVSIVLILWNGHWLAVTFWQRLPQQHRYDTTFLQWRSQDSALGGGGLESLSLPFTSSSSSFPSFPSPSLPFPSLPLEIGLLNTAKGSGSAVSSPAGSGAEPQPKLTLVHFGLKNWHLVATILIFFLRISWPNFVFFKQYRLLYCNTNTE